MSHTELYGLATWNANSVLGVYLRVGNKYSPYIVDDGGYVLSKRSLNLKDLSSLGYTDKMI